MKNKQIAVGAVIASCLLFCGFTFAATAIPGPDDLDKIPVRPIHQAEQVTTNVLLRQILAEMIKANSLKEDKRCTDGGKHYYRVEAHVVLRCIGK